MSSKPWPDRLIAISQKKFGEDWRRCVSAYLGINAATLRRWINQPDEYPIPVVVTKWIECEETKP